MGRFGFFDWFVLVFFFPEENSGYEYSNALIGGLLGPLDLKLFETKEEKGSHSRHHDKRLSSERQEGRCSSLCVYKRVRESVCESVRV